MSVKILQVGAFHLENGAPGASQSDGWGAANSAKALGSNDAVPWLQWPKGKTINSTEDNSIVGDGFKEIPRKVTEYVEKPLSFYSRFDGMDPFHYWSFGFETAVVRVVVFQVTTPSVDPTAGAVYENASSEELTFLRKENWNGSYLYVFRKDGAWTSGMGTVTLTKVSGTGDASLSTTGNSGVLYEHLYELDSKSRHLTEFETDERVTGWSTGAKKNRAATIGIKMGTQDYRYKNSMCKGFGFRSNAGQMAEFFGDFIAHDEERGNFSSANWTYPATRNGNDNVIMHHDIVTQLGTSPAALVNLGVTSLELGCQIPLTVDQDNVSGVKLSEPILEGFYDVSFGMTLSRHSADTYQSYRDDWTKMVGRVAARQNYLMSEYLFEELVVSEAGPDEGDVAREPLVLSTGRVDSTNWSSWLYGNTLVHKGPMVLRVRNTSSVNQMFAN